jgi:hypothetical protein
MYLRIIDNIINYPYTIEQLKTAHKNVSFAQNMTDSMLAEWDVFSVISVQQPTNYTKNIIEGEPTLIDGLYYQNWIQNDASSEEIALRIEDKWLEIRYLRNSLLTECDWTQLSDVSESIKNSYQSYRQSLRDITNQSDPFNISWPVKP